MSFHLTLGCRPPPLRNSPARRSEVSDVEAKHVGLQRRPTFASFTAPKRTALRKTHPARKDVAISTISWDSMS